MGGVIQYSWRGAGDTWIDPGAPGTFIRDAARTPRWFPKNYSMSSTIMSKGVQNAADSSQFSEATKHAGVDAKKNLR